MVTLATSGTPTAHTMVTTNHRRNVRSTVESGRALPADNVTACQGSSATTSPSTTQRRVRAIPGKSAEGGAPSPGAQLVAPPVPRAHDAAVVDRRRRPAAPRRARRHCPARTPSRRAAATPRSPAVDAHLAPDERDQLADPGDRHMRHPRSLADHDPPAVGGPPRPEPGRPPGCPTRCWSTRPGAPIAAGDPARGRGRGRGDRPPPPATGGQRHRRAAAHQPRPGAARRRAGRGLLQPRARPRDRPARGRARRTPPVCSPARAAPRPRSSSTTARPPSCSSPPRSPPGREVIVSRGELVEIGGGFRIPEVLAASGARLVEVGTTNRTRSPTTTGAVTRRRRRDPEGAPVELPDGRLHRVRRQSASWPAPTCRRSSSTSARACSTPPARGSPAGRRRGWRTSRRWPRRSRAGAALVTFSGDKLLGGPQAGIIAGPGRPGRARAPATRWPGRCGRAAWCSPPAGRRPRLPAARRRRHAAALWRMATAPVDASSVPGARRLRRWAARRGRRLRLGHRRRHPARRRHPVGRRRRRRRRDRSPRGPPTPRSSPASRTAARSATCARCCPEQDAVVPGRWRRVNALA